MFAKLFGRIFGSETVLKGAVNGLRDGLDALVYTDEERAGDAATERAAARAAIVDWLKNSQGQNIARRLIALIITCVWLLMFLLAAALDVASIWVDSTMIVDGVAVTSTRVADSATAIGIRADNMTGAMMLILAFYFAAPHMGSIVGAALGRFGAPAANLDKPSKN